MNYIKRLQLEAAAAKKELAAVKQGLDDLRSHLASSKFRCGDRLDGYVNISDIRAYLRNAEEAGTLAGEAA